MQVRRRGEGAPPYGTVCRGGRLCPPGPDNATPCRAGPVCPAGCGKNSGRAVEDAGPYGWVARGCGMSGRCRHRPLRKRNKRFNGRATARVAPTNAVQGVQWAGDRKGRPYGWVARSAVGRRRGEGAPPYGGDYMGPRSFFVFMQIYTGKTAWDLLYSSL